MECWARPGLADPSPFAAAADGVRVAIRLTPGAGRNRVVGLARGPDGGVALKATVTAAPEAGKANAALIRLLAKEWKVAKTRISVARGASSRRKMLHLRGDTTALLDKLNDWIKTRVGSRHG